MTTYILLRDNKESTPLTLSALQGIGIKSSDLIWVEGQSVCWLSPGQIKELRGLVLDSEPLQEKISQDAITSLADPLPIPDIETDQPAPTIYHSKDEIEKPSQPEKEEASIEHPVLETKEKIVIEQPAATVPDPKHVFVSLPEKKQETPVSKEVEKEYAKFLPSDRTKEKSAVKEAFPIAETKYSKPLAEIKQLYLENLEKKNNKKVFQIPTIPPQLKRVGFYVVLFITGLTAGLIIKNSFAKKQEFSQAQLPRTAATETLEQPVTSNEIPAYSEPIINNELQGEPKTAPAVNRTRKDDDVNFPGINPAPETNEQEPIVPVPAPVETEQAEPKPAEEEKPVRKPSIKEIYSQVAVKNNDYSVGSFGGIKNLELTVTNHSRYALDEVDVQVKYFKPMDEYLKSETISFRSIPPGGSKTIAVPKSSRGVKISCRVKTIESKDFLNNTAGL